MSFFSKMLLQIKSKNITIKTETINIKENDGGKQMGDRKDTRGITIIALVITIVLLLILAGVTIASFTGDKGVLNETKDMKKNIEDLQNKTLNDMQQVANDLSTSAGDALNP